MVRRTKEDALATRGLILDTAERVFEQRGVSRTSLNEIALKAGLSRGAIYWHFKDKAALFDAMMQRVLLPLEEAIERTAEGDDGADPIALLRLRLVAALERIVKDNQVRRVFGIAIHKVEYVDELAGVRRRRVESCKKHIQRIESAIDAVKRSGRMRRPEPAAAAALALHAMIDGLIQNWMLDAAAFDLVEVGAQAFDTYVAGLTA